MKKVFLSLLLLLALSITSSAQDQVSADKTYSDAVFEMLKVSKQMDLMTQMGPQIIAMVKQQIPASATNAPTQEFWDELNKVITAMTPKILNAMIPIYRKYLTLEDVQGLIEFYKTPLGEKLADSSVKISMESMPVAQKIGMETMQELMAKVKEKGYIK